MPKISTEEFKQLPLRVHSFLAGVPLHDVWAVDLPRWRGGITLEDFLETTSSCLCKPPPLVRMLLGIRFFVKRFFSWDWDREPAVISCESFATRLTVADCSKSLIAPGRQDGFFRVVYRFKNEQLVELINKTVHAAALSALVETSTAYRFYLAIYVRSMSRFTPFYMRAIDPVRRLIVYPSLLRSARARWNQAFAPG